MLPAAVAAAGIAAALLIAPRAGSHAERLQAKHPKIASALTTLANAVDDTKRLLVHRGGWTSVLGVVAYLGFDVLVLWTAFLAIHAHPLPGFAIVMMAYIIGALGGSIPLPASIGTIGGMAGMLILYGVAHNAAIAAVLLHQAIGLLVPLTGGAIAYATLRRRVGPIVRTADEPGRASQRSAARDQPRSNRRGNPSGIVSRPATGLPNCPAADASLAQAGDTRLISSQPRPWRSP